MSESYKSIVYKFNQKNQLEVQELISNKNFATVQNFKTKDLVIEGELNIQRKLSHWQDNGLLPRTQDYHIKKEFTFLEVIWIYIITDLRKLGFSQKQIQKVRFQLFELMSIGSLLDAMVETFNSIPTISQEEYDKASGQQTLKDTNNQFLSMSIEKYNPTVLAVIIADCIKSRDRVFLSIDENASVKPFRIDYLNSMEYSDAGVLGVSSIVIPIHTIIGRVVQNKRMEFIVPQLEILSEDELYVIDQIRDQKVQSITIEFNSSNEIKIIRSSEPNNLSRMEKELIENLLSKGKYERLIIDSEDGNLARFERVKKKKSKKKGI